ncbi:hypothetical protein GCM10025859_55580 [Alicyclobacillus fastidiosus]|nr:hypothetical protein GCM10025859_55580 [Alicyclobacillus fastidiosus]
MKRIGGTVVGAVLVVSSLVTGCSSNQGSSGSSNGKIVLNMAWWGDDSRAQVTEQAVKDFEKIHANIQVNVSYSGWNGYWQKITTELSGGNGPDVMQQDVSTLSSYAQRGALLSLSKNAIDTSSISSAALDSGVINGNLYAIPAGIEGVTMFYNPSLLQKAGVTITQNEQLTWTQYAKIANQVTQKVKGVYGTPDLSGDEVAFQFYLRENGENEYTASGKLGFDKQTFENWLNYWASLRKSGAAPRPLLLRLRQMLLKLKAPLRQGKRHFPLILRVILTLTTMSPISKNLWG